MLMLYKWLCYTNANVIQMQMIIICSANINANDLQMKMIIKWKWFANDYDY